jgi:uncharacterized protein with HEPN domain
MSEIRNIFIDEILTTIKKIKLKLKDYTFEEFKSDFHIVENTIRYLNIIGEASKHISEELKLEYPDIPWDTLADLRNILNNPEHISLVWDIAKEKLKNLKPDLEKL